MLNTAVIVLGGDAIPSTVMEEIPERRWVIAADSGLDHAAAIGLHVDFIVGDMDSVSTAGLQAHTGPVDQHPVDKDATDFEIALDHVLATPNITRIIVLGGAGGRIDHWNGVSTERASTLCVTTSPCTGSPTRLSPCSRPAESFAGL